MPHSISQTFSHFRRNAYAPLLTALFLPLLVQLIWLLHNTQLPIADADGMLTSSFLISQRLAHHLWWDFVQCLYTIRDYRPTALYLVELPFQIISGGNQMFTASAMVLVCTAITCVYLYKLLRLALERWQAALCTAVLGLLPGVQWPATFFAFSEHPHVPAVLATVYHLIRSKDFRNLHHSIYFSLALTIALMMRPVETLTHLLLLLALFLTLAWRRGSISLVQVYGIVAGAAISASILVLGGWFHHGFESHSQIFDNVDRGILFVKLAKVILLGTGLVMCAGIAWVTREYLKKRGGIRPPYAFVAFAASYIIVVLFYYGFVVNLVDWIYSNSLGDLAREVHKEPIQSILRRFFFCAGALPLVGTTILGVVSFIFCLAREQKKALLRHPLLYLFCMIPLVVFPTLVSVQFHPRKVSLIFCCVMLLMLIPAVMRGRWWKLRVSLLVLIAAWQLCGLLWIGMAQPFTPLLEYTVGSGEAFPTMVTLRPNPHDTFADFLVENAPRYGLKNIMMPIVTSKPGPIDPFLLGTVVVTRDKGFYTGFPYVPYYEADTMVKAFTKYGADGFILISDEERPIEQSPKETVRLQALRDKAFTPNQKMAFDLLARYTAGKMDAVGAKKLACTTIVPTGFEACLFSFKKR